MNTDPRRIMLVVAGRLFRDCIQHALQKPRCSIISKCDNLVQLEIALESVAPPDLIIVHIAFPEDAAETFAHIRRLQASLPGVRWLVLSRDASLDFLRDAIGTGVAGLLLEDSSGEVLQLVTELVLLGHSFLPAEMARLFVQPADTGSTAAAVGNGHRSNLSDREKDILRCLVRGQSNKHIARDLQIAEATVKVHVQALLRKMQVTNRTQAAISARNFLSLAGKPETRLLPPDNPPRLRIAN